MRRVVLLLMVTLMVAATVAMTATSALAKQRRGGGRDTREDRSESGFVNSSFCSANFFRCAQIEFNEDRSEGF